MAGDDDDLVMFSLKPYVSEGRNSSTISRQDSKASVASFFHDLPESLVSEILTRLPCKSCFKFKLVCKQWLAMISQPYFIRQFIRLRYKIPKPLTLSHDSNTRTSGVQQLRLKHPAFVFDNGYIVSKDPDFEFRGHYSFGFIPCQDPIRIVDCCNGLLLCCYKSKTPSSSSSPQEDYLVCNPITKQWRQLPHRPNPHREAAKVALVSERFVRYNEDRNDVDLNFGHSYKVVRSLKSINNLTSSKLEVDIFSSTTGEWKQMSALLPSEIKEGLCAIVYAYDPTSQEDTFNFIELPQDLPEWSNCRFGLYKERKRVSVITQQRGHHSALKIWESVNPSLREWRLVNNVTLGDMKSEDAELINKVKSLETIKILFFHQDDWDLLYLLLDGSSIVLCNIRTMTLEVVVNLARTEVGFLLLRLQLQGWPTPIPESTTT